MTRSAGPTVCLIISTITVEQVSTPSSSPPSTPTPPPPPPTALLPRGRRLEDGLADRGRGRPCDAVIRAAQGRGSDGDEQDGQRETVGLHGRTLRLVTGTHPAMKQEAFRLPPLNPVRCSVRTCDSEQA